MLTRAIAVGLGVYKPPEPAADERGAMETLRAMFPSGKV
jgi:hypothetical protein